MMKLIAKLRLSVLLMIVGLSSSIEARDFVLTIGGGYAPSGNQASLEKNVLLFRRTLQKEGVIPHRSDTFFADGNDPQADLQVVDAMSIPKSNRLMAEFFGSNDDLGLSYRNHKISNVRGPSQPDQIRSWFREVKREIMAGDRLLIYVTAHGQESRERNNEYNTSIAMWNNSAIQMEEFAALLDELPDEIHVVMIMVQCYTGGFSHVMFRGGDPEKGLSPQRRIGFFATVHDRPAAGCTPDADETNYAEYSTYFWAAFSGVDRAGNPIERPDYNRDGQVSFEEAHAYTILNSDTIDLPVETSGEFLTIFSRFANEDEKDSKLLRADEPYDVILSLASPTQKVVLEGLSKQLNLEGDKRLDDAWRASRPQRRRGRARAENEISRLRTRIATDAKARWPELANVLNPVSVDLMTSRQAEFISALEQHRDYRRYEELKSQAESNLTDQNQRVKYERLLRIADNVVLAENLRRLGESKELEQFDAIVAAERATLK